MWDKLLNCWWGQILVGLFFLACAAFFYWRVTSLEATGGIMLMHWTMAIIYNIAGKWGGVLLFVIPGLFVIGVGIRNLLVGFRDND